MSSAVDIQIVSAPNLAKIESYLKDASYRETIEYSANFNTRLCIERRLRLPFLDPQTGVAQNHSHLFVDKRQRMPGFREGQLYTYPAARWRKSRRQYLNKMYKFPDRPFQALRKDHEALVASTATSGSGGTASPTVTSVVTNDPEFNSSLLEESSSLGAAGGDTSDSKDSQQQVAQQLKEDLPKEWFYDEMDMHDNDSLEEPKSPADDEYDYDPRYGTKKRRKRKPGKKPSLTPGESPGPGRRQGGAGRGRSVAAAAAAAASLGDSSMSGLDSVDGMSATDTATTAASPATPAPGRRPRGTGTRGRRRTKNQNANNGLLSSGHNAEPPSFESVAAAVGVLGDLPAVVDEHNADLRNYRKYL
uniref:DPF1-3 N-terminal domain-containing protein n=1 Tax=Musca domestica TaxID=7370 RepID=A0A1I8N2V0_MUSDO